MGWVIRVNGYLRYNGFTGRSASSRVPLSLALQVTHDLTTKR